MDTLLNGPVGKQLFRLFDIAFVPNFACNIISFRKLQRRGIWWDSRPEHNCLRRADQSILAFLTDRHDQFVLEDIPEEMTQTAFFTRRNKFNSYTKRKPNRASAEVWHRRLGHPGPRALEHLVNSSQGVRIKGLTTVQCDECGTSKAKRQIRRTPRDRGLLAERLAIDFHDFKAG